MTEKIRLGISSCLLGEEVRYDRGHKLDHFLTDTLGQFVEWVPVCPEVEYGLPVPREAMRLTGLPENPRLVTRKTGIDHTEGMKKWARTRLKELQEEDLCGFVFKSRSPSSGMSGVKVYSESGMPSRKGKGIFACAFMDYFLFMPVEDDGRMHNPRLRENFIERIFVYKRWKDFLANSAAMGDLVSFHTDHKYLIMAHSPKHLSILGKIVANAKLYKRSDLFEEYFRHMIEGLRLEATVKKNVNVLTHMVGYFKEVLTPDEKKELLEIVGNYHKGLVPLIVPVTLIKHYVRKYQEPYLKRQYYLHPHPLELMLRNHV
jgi:uncharacterized protein YbgA (DUF1722 family)/uncharacterized protein YbbK (DUF523 family)